MTRPEPTPEDPPAQRPEGALLRSAMLRMGLSPATAAPRAGITSQRWRNIINGYQPLGGGQYTAVRAPAERLAKMALVLDVTPEQLDEVGRQDAAEVLRGILASDHTKSDYEDEALGGAITDPTERQIWDLPMDLETRRDFIALYRNRRHGQHSASRRRQASG